MLGISIELGTYSIKLISYQIDKKSTKLLSTDEIVLEHNLDQEVIEDENHLWSEQMRLLREYLLKLDHEYQILLNIPSQIVSTRYLTLPVKNKKKAYQMLPFQIEEDLPYSINDCAYGESFIITEEHTKALVGIVKNEHFEGFYELLKEHQVRPHVLTCDTSNYAGFIKKCKDDYPETFSIINIGHASTRGFYFLNGELISNHQSYIAGDAVTKAISKTYSISYDEATLYKHQNSFLLLDEQFDHVNDNQKEFAMLMDSTLALLISEIKRWDIGFRVKYGQSIKHIYICGGTANIKNIKNYLSAKLGVEVHFFNPYQFMDTTLIDQDSNLRRKFAQVATLSLNAVRKGKLINFLKGDLALTQGSVFPLESLSFIAVRTFIITLLFSIFFISETIITNGKINTADKVIKSLSQNQFVQGTITSRTIRSLIGKGTTSKSLIQTKNKFSLKDKQILQEVKTIQSALNLNALKNLNAILDYISNMNVEIIKFVSESGNVDFVLTSPEPKILKEISENFKNDNTQSWIVDLNPKTKLLSVSGKGFTK